MIAIFIPFEDFKSFIDKLSNLLLIFISSLGCYESGSHPIEVDVKESPCS